MKGGLMSTNDKFITAMKYMNDVVKADNAAGHQWKYCNTTSKKATDFPSAREQKKFRINCVDGVQWAAKIAGVPSSALEWFCQNGKIVWCGTNAKSRCKKYFDIIHIGNRTVKQLQAAGVLLPGDILGYETMSHTNAYYKKGKSFDSGHAFAQGSGEGAKIMKFIGSLQYQSMKVSYILRLKNRTRYRVQVGAFQNMNVLVQTETSINHAGFPTIRINEDGMVKLQAGLFDSKTNAEKLVKKLRSRNIGAIIKEV